MSAPHTPFRSAVMEALGGRVEALMVACVALGAGASLAGVALARALTPTSLLAAAVTCAICAVAVALGASRAGARRRERMGALLGVVFELSGRKPKEGLDFVNNLAWSGEPDTGVSKLESEIRSIGRAYRSLEVERDISQRLVASQDAERSAFFARLSYQLRSPLNAIFGYTSLLLEEVEDDPHNLFKSDLVKIRSAGNELLAQIDTLLDVAGNGAEKASETDVPFSLPDLLVELGSHFQSQFLDKRLEIVGGGEVTTVVGNRRRVMRALTTLIDDAVRERNAISLSLRSGFANRAGMVEVVLDAEREFERRAGAGEASGIGLQAADALARSIGGSLSLETAGKTGFRYLFQFPVDAREDVAPAPAPTAVEAPVTLSAVELNDANGKIALVIDDDVAALELLSRWLQRVGYQVLGATSAEEGLEIARRETPDIILLDALMPGRTGYDVVPDMRALPALANTPILIISVDDDRGRGLQAGASDFIRKPVTEEQLRRLISVFDTDQAGEILIVDDDEDAAELLARTATRLGFTPRKARDGAEGLQALRESTPRAILLDLNMPEVDGFEMIEAISLDPRLAKVPLIVVSGQDLSTIQHRKLISAGAQVFRKGSAAQREIAAGLREAVA